jgi:hypothetical protein
VVNRVNLCPIRGEGIVVTSATTPRAEGKTNEERSPGVGVLSSLRLSLSSANAGGEKDCKWNNTSG